MDGLSMDFSRQEEIKISQLTNIYIHLEVLNELYSLIQRSLFDRKMNKILGKQSKRRTESQIAKRFSDSYSAMSNQYILQYLKPTYINKVKKIRILWFMAKNSIFTMVIHLWAWYLSKYTNQASLSTILKPVQ